MADNLDPIWKALGDATRREILDFLRGGPKTTTQIVERFPHLSRFAVMKHLDILRESKLVETRSEGRRRINSLNAAPIRQIAERWISKFDAVWSNTLLRVKEDAEAKPARRGTKTNPSS